GDVPGCPWRPRQRRPTPPVDRPPLPGREPRCRVRGHIMNASPATTNATERPPRAASGTSLILVVDPDPDARDMYVTSLTLAGWTADGITDGREALAKALTCR